MANKYKTKLESILKDLKELLHKGRSTILQSDIREIVNKYKYEDER